MVLFKLLYFLIFSIFISFSSYGSEKNYNLTVENKTVNFANKEVKHALAINGSIPAPTLRFKKGDKAVIHITNKANEPTTIHWHGVLVPWDMDGPAFSNNKLIQPNETFTFRFPIKHTGTYWYHSHTSLQEQRGLYGAIVIKDSRPRFRFNHDIVAVLSDWTNEKGSQVLANLKKEGEYYSYKKRFFPSLVDAISKSSFKDFIKGEWSGMGAMDLSDVGYDAFLINGKQKSVISKVRPGDKIRLRVINAGASTHFYLNLGENRFFKVISKDGVDVRPVKVSEIFIGMGETYDLLVTMPKAKRGLEFRATASDITGYGNLIFGNDDRYELVPDFKKINPYKMDHGEHSKMSGHDMSKMPGHDMSKMSGHDMSKMPKHDMSKMPKHDMSKMPKHKMSKMPKHDMSKMPGHDMSKMSGHDMSKMPGHDMSKMSGHDMSKMPKHDMSKMSGHDMSKMPKHDMSKMSGHDMSKMPKHKMKSSSSKMDQKIASHLIKKQLDYKILKSVKKTKYSSKYPRQNIHIKLNGSMGDYTWTLNGKPFSEEKYIIVRHGEVVRIHFQNKTMMTHPMHLHGHFFRVLNGQGDYAPLFHTVDVKPLEEIIIEAYMNEPGIWAFHCHNLYHMKMGMMRLVKYKDFKRPEDLIKHEKEFSGNFLKDSDVFFKAKILLYTNYSRISLGAKKGANKFKFKAKIEDNDVETFEIESVVSRRFKGFPVIVIAGVIYEHDELQGLFGLSYLLPLRINLEAFIKTGKEIEIELEKEIPIWSGLNLEVKYTFESELNFKDVEHDIKMLLDYQIHDRLKIGTYYNMEYEPENQTFENSIGVGLGLLF